MVCVSIISDMSRDKHHEYERTHPWVTFRLDMRDVAYEIWMFLGEAKSKCQHLSMVPLNPILAKEMQTVFLAKGIQATTAIEGNTLSLDEVRKRLEGIKDLPPSKEYLGVEIDNVLAAVNKVAFEVVENPSTPLSSADILRYNAQILAGLQVEAGVIPGEIRTYEVSVGPYCGTPSKDCPYLLDRMCEWLNDASFVRSDDMRIPFGILRAVMAHLYIAWIHPFGDGNGRTARLLEVKILIQAGIPTVAAHLLSNHYNATRSEYYRQLQRASATNGDVGPFIKYAVQGFVDQLVEQLSMVWAEQWKLAFVNYIHETLAGDGQTEKRQRHLMLALIDVPAPVNLTTVKTLSVKVALAYKRVSARTLLRDLKRLESEKLVLKTPTGYLPNRSLIRQFMPGQAKK